MLTWALKPNLYLDGAGGGTASDGSIFTQEQYTQAVTTSRKDAVNDVLTALGYGGKTLQEVKDLKAEEARSIKEKEEESLKSKGKFDDLLKVKQTEYEDNIAKEKARADKFEGLYKKTVIESSLTREAARLGAVDTEVVVSLLIGEAILAEDNKTVMFKGENDVAVTVSQKITKLLDERKYLKKSDFTPNLTDEERINLKKQVKDIKSDDEKKTDMQKYLDEIAALNEEYRGRHMDKEYSDKRAEIKKKYKQK